MKINDIPSGIPGKISPASSSTKPELTQVEGKSRINHAGSLKDTGSHFRHNTAVKQHDTPSAARFGDPHFGERVFQRMDKLFEKDSILQPKADRHSNREYEAIKAKYRNGLINQTSTQQERPPQPSIVFESVNDFTQLGVNQAAKPSSQAADKERPLTVDDILPIDDDDIPGSSATSVKSERPLTVDDILPIDEDDIPGSSATSAKNELQLAEDDIRPIDINDLSDSQIIPAKHVQRLSLTNELSQEVLNKINTLADNGKIELGPVERQEIAQLRESLNGLNELKPYVLEGKHHTLPDRYSDFPKAVLGADILDMRIATDYLSLHQTCTTALANLATLFPNELLPMMDDFEQLNVLSSEVIKALDRECTRMVKNIMQLLGNGDTAARSATDYSISTRDSIANSSNDAIAEAQFQMDILGILNSAISEYSQTKLDSHRNSFLKTIDCFGIMDAENYGKRLESELEKNFGPFFDISVTGDESISVNLRKGVLGSLPSNDFLQILNAVRDSLENQYDKETITAAVKVSPDIELAGAKGKEQITFTDKAKARLAQAHALADVAPVDKLRNNITQAAEQITVASVKSTLLSYIEKDVKKQIDRLNKSLLPSNLRIAKFALIENLISDLAKSHSTQDMLDRVNQAIDDHDKRLKKNLIKRINHDTGETGKILENMAGILKTFVPDNK